MFQDFRTLDKRNRENSRFLCRLIENDRIETTAYAAKWATILGNRVINSSSSKLICLIFLPLHDKLFFHRFVNHDLKEGYDHLINL